MDKFTEMGKVELRAACKEAGISYNKLNNDGMRMCLRAHEDHLKNAAKAAKTDGHTGTGVKIEKDREERNGIKRPSAGGKCRAIWDALDAYQVEEKEVPTADVVRELAKDEGWNSNNAMIEFYQWRKFHGINGRSK